MTRQAVAGGSLDARVAWLLLFPAFAALPLPGQEGTAPRPGLSQVLRFEAPHAGKQPGGWSCRPCEDIVVDQAMAHGGGVSVRIERRTAVGREFSSIGYSIPIAFTGKTVEFRGFLTTMEVQGYAALVLREDQGSRVVAFETMEEKQPVTGTTGWARYSVRLPIDPAANSLHFFVILSGAGTAWVDGLELLVDGQPLVERRTFERESDHEFDDGSHVVLTDLTPMQIENLTTLGKVWGFLKYQHPQVAAGRYQWDYELFRTLPAILKAADHAAADSAMAAWINALGEVSNCNPCALLDSRDLDRSPKVDWLADTRLLAPLRQRLWRIFDNRTPGGKRFYAFVEPDSNRMSFDNEPKYEHGAFPDAGFQLLALYRFWNIVEYWSPDKAGMTEDWDAVLAEYIPRIALAKDALTYRRELAALIARAHDGNANLWDALESLPPVGACQLPVNVRFLDGQAVVNGYSAEPASVAGLRPGDIMEAIDGVQLSQLRNNLAPFYAASNEAARRRDMGRNLTRGNCSEPVTVRIRRDGEQVEVNAVRLPVGSLDLSGATRHDLAGPPFRLLSGKVAYLKLSGFKAADARGYIERAANTVGLVIDLRNNPSETSVFALGQFLIDQPREFARLTYADLWNPGAFHWSQPVGLTPSSPRYAGKVVILVDEVTQGEAEYTAMALRAVPGAVIIGSTTAGAAADRAWLVLPGGLRCSISAFGVFYPDKKPTQGLGIVADVAAAPTVDGIRAGRDQVLEVALRQILGPQIPAAEIVRMIN
jgi:C-terminal processing protease CtpA/Prc